MVSEKEFNALLVQYTPYIIGQVLRNGGGVDTEDCTQDVMLHACRRRSNFDPDKGAFPTWMFWQIRSCMQQRRIRQHKRRDLNYSMEYHDNGDPVTEVSVLGNQQDHVELRETLDAVSELKPKQAYVVLQRAVGVTLEELSGELDLSRQRIEQIQSSAVRNLRKQMNRKPAMVGAL